MYELIYMCLQRHRQQNCTPKSTLPDITSHSVPCRTASTGTGSACLFATGIVLAIGEHVTVLFAYFYSVAVRTCANDRTTHWGPKLTDL